MTREYGAGGPNLSDDDDEEIQRGTVSPSTKERRRRRSHGKMREEHTLACTGKNKCMWILLVATLLGLLALVAVGVVRELVWHAHIVSITKEANSAVTNAALIAQRTHHTGKNLDGDIKALAHLVKIELAIDAAAKDATTRVASAGTVGSQKKAAKEEKGLVGTKLLGVEPAVESVVHAIEKDIAGSEGHPLLIGPDGLPLSKNPKNVAIWGEDLAAATKEIDAGLVKAEQYAEALKNVKKDADEKKNKAAIQEHIKDLANDMDKLEKFQTKTAAAIAVVADDATKQDARGADRSTAE